MLERFPGLLEHFLPGDHYLLQNDYWFRFGVKIFATKWRLGFIIQKSFKKTLATKWQSGCLLQNGFPESFFFFGRISEWSFCSVHKSTHSVVEIQRGIQISHLNRMQNLRPIYPSFPWGNTDEQATQHLEIGAIVFFSKFRVITDIILGRRVNKKYQHSYQFKRVDVDKSTRNVE